MRRVMVALATAIGVVAGFLASGAQAINGCRGHSTQADCTAEKLCTWSTEKNKCSPVRATPQSARG
jgi:hypothetical protein